MNLGFGVIYEGAQGFQIKSNNFVKRIGPTCTQVLYLPLVNGNFIYATTICSRSGIGSVSCMGLNISVFSVDLDHHVYNCNYREGDHWGRGRARGGAQGALYFFLSFRGGPSFVPGSRPGPRFMCREIRSCTVEAVSYPFYRTRSSRIDLLPAARPRPLRGPHSSECVRAQGQLFYARCSICGHSSQVGPRGVDRRCVPYP